MKDSRLPIGSSDPVSFQCTCSAESNGLVLLFYRYFSAPPCLPPPSQHSVSELADFHISRTTALGLGGKIRVANEGFNITVGGTKSSIEQYIQNCISNWSFDGLYLDSEEKQKLFFKPTPRGCACVFGGSPASVRITSEITPMGVTNYLPSNWDSVESLNPAEFHKRCWSDEKKVLVDVRNHYESRIGYFVDPKTGVKAITPEIRRFSQWPQYVKTHKSELNGSAHGNEKRQIMTYCTGGIRCEKGVRWMAEQLDQRQGDVICTLKGGIAAYLVWMEEEVKAGRKGSEESLFHGKNYVFDARGSMGMSGVETDEKVATCHVCGVAEDRLSKCRSEKCHIILVVCATCEDTADPRCCGNCLDLDISSTSNEDDTRNGNRSRPICTCEIEREARLWGHNVGKPKSQGWKKERRKNQGINIQLRTID